MNQATVVEEVAPEQSVADRTPSPALRQTRKPRREAATDRARPTPADRLALLAEVSAHAWIRTGGTMPLYTRATMPVVVSTLDGTRARG